MEASQTPDPAAPSVAPAPEAAAPVPEPTPVQPGSITEGGVLPSPSTDVQPPADPTSAPADTQAATPAPVADPAPPSPSPQEQTAPVPAAPVPDLPPGATTGEISPEGDVLRKRDDDDVLTGQFATVVDGPYAGRYVVFQKTLTSGDDGYPSTVLVKTRDDRDEQLEVDYKALRPAAPGGR